MSTRQAIPLTLPIRDAIERQLAATGRELTEDDLRMIGREAAEVLKARTR